MNLEEDKKLRDLIRVCKVRGELPVNGLSHEAIERCERLITGGIMKRTLHGYKLTAPEPLK